MVRVISWRFVVRCVVLAWLRLQPPISDTSIHMSDDEGCYLDIRGAFCGSALTEVTASNTRSLPTLYGWPIIVSICSVCWHPWSVHLGCGLLIAVSVGLR